MPGITGLMKTGDAGSDVSGLAMAENGGVIDKPFMFFGRLGAGDVIGRSFVVVVLSATLREAKDGNPSPLKEGLVRDERGSRFTGESGDEDGDGSDREEESVQETVVVGEDSADSEF